MENIKFSNQKRKTGEKACLLVDQISNVNGPYESPGSADVNKRKMNKTLLFQKG